MDELDRRNARRLDIVYKKFHNAGAFGCLTTPMSSHCTMRDGLIWTFILLTLSTLLLLSRRRVVRRLEKRRLPTPPGANGWPLIGETYRFYYSEDTSEFVRRRVEKYGEIFYSNIIGGPHVMVHAPEFLRFMLVDPRQVLFGEVPTFAKKLFGPGTLIADQGKVHAEKYSLTLRSLSTKYHEAWIAGFNDVMRKTVDSWQGRTINCHDESQKMFIDTGFVYILGMINSDKELQERLASNVRKISKGLLSVPVNIPGTGFGRAMQARKDMDQLLIEKLEEHLKMREGGLKPQFYSVMEFVLDSRQHAGKEVSMKDPDCVQMILDQVTVLLHSQFETLTHSFTWAMKFLSENPEVLRRVKAEQDAIRSTKMGSDYIITGEDLAKMTYSLQVFQETLRLASVIGIVLRKAKTDFEYKGFNIPKGWTLHAAIRALHYNPDYFPDPHKFDPSRFQDAANIKPDTYLPFGFGNRGCLGKTLVKMQVLLAFHYITTRLRWTALDPAATINYNPQAHVKGGYPIQVHAD